MSIKTQEQIDALTSLRFFAAFYVLIFHSGGPALSNSGLAPRPLVNFLANGYLGVTFFFVLSGFILTYVYHGRLNSPDDTRKYAKARFARVYPVYLLSLLLMIPFVPFKGLFHALPQFFLLQSWIPFTMADDTYIGNWNMQAWTLSVELLFYLSFPVALTLMQRWSLKAIIVALVICCGLMLIFRLPEIRGPQNLIIPFLYHVPIPFLRLPEFLYGVGLGIIFCRGLAPKSGVVLYAAMIAILATLVASKSPWVAPIVAILIGVVIFLVPTSLGDGWLKTLLCHRWMVLLGGASYCLYILQLPVHLIVGWIFSGPFELIGKFAYIPILTVLSIAIYLWYEEPMRQHIKNFGRRQTVPAE